MGIFKLIWWRPSRPTTKPRVAVPKPVGVKGTPIHSIRRKFLWLGDEYGVVLKLDVARNSLRIDSDNQSFVVSLNPPTRENFDLFMENWYRRQARKEFQRAVDLWLPLFHGAGYDHIQAPRLKIFRMRRAWGRCYYMKGLITMNLHLIKAPRPCIEYIVLHELCHFAVNNHSRTFYDLVERFMPDWRAADSLLKAFAREHRIIR